MAHGDRTPPIPAGVLRLFEWLPFVLHATLAWLRARTTGRGTRIEMALVFAGLAAAAAWGMGAGDDAWHAFEWSLVALLVCQWGRLNLILAGRVRRPVVLLPLNVLALILLGTLLIKLPEAIAYTSDDAALRLPVGGHFRWLDAFFTMAGAVCVTGLSVRDLSQFSVFGQVLIGLFMQLGGLLVLVFGSQIVFRLSRRLVGCGRLLRHGTRRAASFVRVCVVVTVLIELGGALALMPLMGSDFTWRQRVGHSLFHASSAFCNAGLALEPDGMAAHRYGAVLHLVILPLVGLGGMGAVVLVDLWRFGRSRWRRRRQDATQARNMHRRLGVHTRVVLVTTAALYVLGVAVVAVAQLMPSIYGPVEAAGTAGRPDAPPLSWALAGAAVADASTLSLTARSAGFHCVPPDQIEPATRFVLILLMSVGASPGGTGGGVKTTTLALLILGAVAVCRRSGGLTLGGRSLETMMPVMAATMLICFVALAAISTTLLCLSEPLSFGPLLFESVSAASTAGLSLGITEQLTPFGKLVLVATMFTGRVGPLLLVLPMCSSGVSRERGERNFARIGLG